MGSLIIDREILKASDRSLLEKVINTTSIENVESELINACKERIKNNQHLYIEQRLMLKNLIQPIETSKFSRNQNTKTASYDDYKDSYD